ncbi:2-phospho-L-lactate guanylyltransferase [Iodidimonas sp. SYSU 1G8]|uniref:2-phospho-L-lactate guanylyltransferase n=1 Tax=Iodidimonas sp. SYSU 1G8 TaxID=3133967 RepID=UPI0031FEE068
MEGAAIREKPNIWALLPVKRLKGAKQRLSPVLSEMERTELARAMLLDVLLALRHAWGLAGVAVVTADTEARNLARQHGATLIGETDGGLNEALDNARLTLHAQGATSALIVHGDLPLATAEEITTLIDAHPPGPAATFVPARDGGTNAMLTTPVDPFPLSYGEGSFARHKAAAEAAGLATASLVLPGLQLDIDTPEDLAELLRRGAGGHTMDYLLASHVATRLQQAAGNSSGSEQ